MRTLDTNPASVPTAAEYEAGLRKIRDDMTLNQLLLLQRHHSAPGRSATARQLADHLGYANWGGTNLQYGLLAKKLAEAMGVEVNGDLVYLLATFKREADVAEGEVQLVMRPQLAAALQSLKWVW